MLCDIENHAGAVPSAKLNALIADCAARVPMYRALEPLVRSHPQQNLLPLLPFTTKDDLRRDFPLNFLPSNEELDRLLAGGAVEMDYTSGTTQDRVALLLKRGWWAAQEQCALHRNARVTQWLTEAGDQARRVTITSPVCNNDINYAEHPTCKERTLGLSRHINLWKHPFLWTEPDSDRMVREAQEWNPLFLDVDPTYGVAFARLCEARGVVFPQLKFIISSYGFLSVVHRRVLERVFRVPVYNLYGSTETGHLLMEDETGVLRASPETAFLEVIETDADGLGELVATTLTNDYMPLLRYRMGDLVERTGCGDDAAYVLHGRAADALHAKEGRRLTTRQVDQSFAGIDGIAHYRLQQTERDAFELRYLPDTHPPTAQSLALLRQRLSQLLGPGTHLKFRAVDLLMSEGSGKFRLLGPLQRAEAEPVTDFDDTEQAA